VAQATWFEPGDSIAAGAAHVQVLVAAANSPRWRAVYEYTDRRETQRMRWFAGSSVDCWLFAARDVDWGCAKNS